MASPKTNFRDYAAETGDALEGAAFEFGGFLANQLNQYLEDEDLVVSRDMQASIVHETLREGNRIEVIAGPETKYAEYVHDGTDPFLPPYQPLRDWVEARGLASGTQDRLVQFTTSDGQDVEFTAEVDLVHEVTQAVRYKISKEGIDANPFLERFNDEKGDEFAERYAEMINERLEIGD